MKFQKTLLAASLAIAAASTVNAAVVSQQAIPVQVTENLANSKYVFSDLEYVDANDLSTGVYAVQAPVHSELASTYNKNVNGEVRVANDYLPELSTILNGTREVGIDLGSQSVSGVGNAGSAVKYDVFKYTGENGQVVYRFQNPTTGKYIDGFFRNDGNGNLVEYTGAVDLNSLQKGGQIDGRTGSTTNSGFENKVINGEHVLYGYQGATLTTAGSVDGTIVAPDGSNTEEYVGGTFGKVNAAAGDIRYVQSGIIANTGDYSNGLNGDGYLDPSKNIYGVSARDNNNVTMLTGNGIALADLSSAGSLQTDGSVANRTLIKQDVGGVQKTREYSVDGKRVLEVYNDDAGRELASQYYEIIGNGADLAEWNGSTPVAGSHIKTGTAAYTSGTFDVNKVHNTVTNKNVTYSETKQVVVQQQVKAGITNPNAATTDIDKTFSEAPTSETTQYVSTGVIKENSGSNVYGTEVVKKVTADGKTTEEKTTITASGIDTTGVINAADYQIGGVSIVDGIKTSVDSAVADASQAIDAKVAEVDEKIVEVDSRLTQFNADAAKINGRVDQLNNRIDDVEKTAYRGVAIALAAQQAIPNLGAGQTAVFGGAGVYESEGAGALGLATVLKDGRTSFSGAIGVAGGGEVGGRVGVAYVFGGK